MSSVASDGELPLAEVRRELVRRGWKQGAVLGPELAARVQLLPYAQLARDPTDRWYAVVSQDCDVVAGNFAAEPAVEVIALELVPQPAWQHLFLRHPRELHIQVRRTDGSLLTVSARIWNRGYIDRRLLLDSSPASEPVLGAREVRFLSSFMQRRYGRVVLPDALVERLRPARARLEKLVSDFPAEILLLLVGFTPDGEPDTPEAPYELRMYVVLSDSAAFDDPGKRRSVQKQILDRLRPALRRCHGIQVEKVSVCDTDELSLGEFMGLTELDFEALRIEITTRGEAREK